MKITIYLMDRNKFSNKLQLIEDIVNHNFFKKLKKYAKFKNM